MVDFHIRLDGVSKNFGQLKVVENLRLDIVRGEFLSLLGPSGSGKTTILMMLAGFQDASEGSILVDGRIINDIPSHRRNMGVVFQSYALFPHMSVAQNVGFPLRMRGVGRAEIRARVEKALDMVQLSALRDRRPTQLSGGQQQRVALARALVFEPGVVLMDEPLGALDKQLREQMQLDIREIHARLGLTIVFVTHDQSEALTMSDRIAVFNKGRIEQIDTPRSIYDRPATRFVAEFIGETNLMEGSVAAREGADALIRLDAGGMLRVRDRDGLAVGQKVMATIRPEKVELFEAPAAENSFPVSVSDNIYQGNHLRLQLQGTSQRFIARRDRRAHEWEPGTAVHAVFAAEDCWVIAQ